MFSKAILLGSLAISAIAQSTTLKLFIDGQQGDEYEAAVVSVDCDTTTLALRCTKGGNLGFGSSVVINPGTTTCDPSATILATYAPSSYMISTSTMSAGTAAEVVETCSLDGTTTAECSYSLSASANGKEDSTQTRVGLATVNFYQVPITSGANKITSCTQTPNAAAPTGVTDVYKILVVPAAVLAGALA